MAGHDGEAGRGVGGSLVNTFQDAVSASARFLDHLGLSASEVEALVTHHHEGQVNTIDVSPDGRLVASGGEGGAVKVWERHTGQLRLTFGFTELLKGFDFLIAVIGLFGIGEILLSMEEGLSFQGRSAKIDPKIVLETWKKLPQYWATSIRSCLIGCWLGITPGGAIAASFMGYNLAKRFSKDPDSFGKGRIEGVFAPETAAHASGTAPEPAIRSTNTTSVPSRTASCTLSWVTSSMPQR